ncbi:MAG: AAA family ATPase, partial [Pirellulaceae bacterium]
MKIKDIQIDGFGVWSGLSVHSLPEGMTVFYGPNEAGKTTLMQFLRTMFYGFTPERRHRYLPPVFGGRPGGSLRVTGPGGGYEINRRTQLDDPTVIGQVAVTGSDGLTQGQHRLNSLLGNVDESIFTNVFAIGLRELQELSTLDDTTAADELYKLSSGLDRVSLVDVMRQLRSARTQLVGPTPESGQVQGMLV